MAEQHNTPTQYTRKRRPGQRMTKQERAQAQETFLKSFRNTANVRASCMTAGIDRTTIYDWLEKDELFSFEYRQAELDANDMLRAEILQRATKGYEKPVVSMGKIVYHDGKPLTEQVKSDQLLMFLARARMPEFREKQQVEHSGSIDINSAKESLLNKLSSMSTSEETA